MAICPECESSIGENDIICVSCGTKLQKDDSCIEIKNDMLADQPGETSNVSKPVSINKESKNIVGRLPTAIDIKIEKVPDDALKQNMEFSSDCPHFKCDWNKGSSIFIADTTSSLSFKLSPLIPEARKASNFKLFLKFPVESSFSEHILRFTHLIAPREIYINYKPTFINIGSEQAVDFYFSYEIDGNTMCFDQQIKIDVYSQNTSKDKILENLTISVGDINQEGYGGDPSVALNLLKDAQDSGSSLNDLLDSLKKTDLWSEMVLFSAIPLSGEKKTKNITIPKPPSYSKEKLTLFTASGHRIHLLSGEITLGRSREADIVMRNLPSPDSERKWGQQRMIAENGKISGMHCKLVANDNTAWIVDTSSNGCFLNNKRIETEKYSIPVQKQAELSLGGPSSSDYNILLQLRVYKSYLDQIDTSISAINTISDLTTTSVKDVISGIVVTRTDDIPESYMIINNWLPLKSIHDGVSEEWAIRKRSGSYALVNKDQWIWLEPGIKLPLDSGLAEVTDFKQYYLND